MSISCKSIESDILRYMLNVYLVLSVYSRYIGQKYVENITDRIVC